MGNSGGALLENIEALTTSYGQLETATTASFKTSNSTKSPGLLHPKSFNAMSGVF